MTLPQHFLLGTQDAAEQGLSSSVLACKQQATVMLVDIVDDDNDNSA